MKRVRMFTAGYCPYCGMAKRLLAMKGVARLEEVAIDQDPAQRDAMIAATGRRTVPQIYVGDTHVGGFDDLAALDRAGKLDGLLAD